MRVKSLLALLLALALVLVAAACGSDDTSSADEDTSANEDTTASNDDAASPIRVGWVGPLSAGAVSEGEEMLAAAEIAVEQINADGGLLGRDVELVVRDTMEDPDTGADAVAELIDDEGVVAIVGEVHSSVAVAEIEVAHDRGVPFVVADSWADEISAAGYEEVFRIAPANSLIYENVSAWVAEAGFTHAFVVVEATAYGENARSLIESALDDTNIDSTFVEVDPEDIDVEAVVADAGAADADLIMVLIASNSAYGAINAVCDAGLAPTSDTALYVGAGPGVAGAMWDEIGDCAENVIAEHLVLPRTEWNDLATGLEADMAARDMNVSIGGFAGFDSVLLVTDAISRAGSTDPAAVIHALASTDLVATRGTYSFAGDAEPAWHFHTFLDAPTTIIQYTAVGQDPSEAEVLAPAEWATTTVVASPG